MCIRDRIPCGLGAPKDKSRKSSLRTFGSENVNNFAASSGERGGLSGQGEDRPDLPHAGDSFFAGAEAQAQFALEAAHAAGQMHQQEPISFEASGTLLGRKAQSLDGAGNIISE